MFINQIVNFILRKLLSVSELTNRELENPKSFLVIRQHNQLGDQLASVSFFRAIKEKYPECKLTVIVSPENEAAIIKNKFIDNCFVFDKKRLYFPSYFIQLAKLLRQNYDVAVVPVTVSISFTSNLIARLSKSKIRIGIKELNGKKNDFDYFFNYRIKMDWRKHPDANVADFCLEMIRPFDITTSNFQSEINFDENDEKVVDEFVKGLNKNENDLLIGLHVGAGKPPNRWSLDKFAELISLLDKKYKAVFYLTGSSADKPELDYLLNRINLPVGKFINKKIPEVAALVAASDIFITNDTGIMHVAGTTGTPQISLFGPTNPFNWAPNGKNKFFIRKSDLIDDISVEDVYKLSESIFTKGFNNALSLEVGMGVGYLAVIDCGSNSFHLLIAKITHDGKFEIIRREREVLRIGLNETEETIITPDAIERAVDTLLRYKNIALEYNASIKAVGTSAIREAKNSKETVTIIEEKTGIKINVIDGKEEARLIFEGIKKAIQLNTEKTLCIDIGGGSTEIIIGQGKDILYLNSFPLGAVRLTQQFFPDYILTENAIKNCEAHTSSILYNEIPKIKDVGFSKCAGTSGTITAAAFMVKALSGEVPDEIYTLNNFSFNRSEFERIFKALIELQTIQERKKITGLDKGRADIIPAGMLILNHLIRNLNIKEITVSGYGIREGVISEFINAAV